MKKSNDHHDNIYWILVFCSLFLGCQSPTKKETPTPPSTNINEAPAWSHNAIWYQIFVERFRNGSDENNPRREDLLGAWPDSIPESWAVTPWTQQWYQPDAWFADCVDDDFYHGIQARRYGGDLIGVLDKLDYLQDLGINAIYFNPLNHAPSLHKYDPTYYHHIDHHFGPDPEHDKKLLEQENMADPTTWVWTKADKLFLEIINACHKRNIRVILDYSWNHTGRTFWAFKDVQRNNENSAFKDWYYIKQFDDKKTAKNEFDYKSWFGATTLPELRENIEGHHDEERITLIEGDLYSQSLKQHIYDVSARWLDPNQDGDPTDGVDGFRLDVAAEVPMGFWRQYRQFVRNINPDAYLVGEVWYEKWPDDLLDPKPFLGDAFDAVMNYRWYREARRLFAQAGEKITPSEFAKRIDMLYNKMERGNQYAMMNVVSSHDCPRVLTSLFNKGKYKFHTNAKNPDYKIHRPDVDTYERLKLLLAHQYTFFGAPHIWNGDEMGMWGGDDPDCRKPLIWPDLTFENETIHPVRKDHTITDKVAFNTELHQFYKKLIKLRTNNEVLRTGEFEFLAVNDDNNTLAYRRFDATDEEIIIIFNLSDKAQTVTLDINTNNSYSDVFSSKQYQSSTNKLTIEIPKLSFEIVKRNL